MPRRFFMSLHRAHFLYLCYKSCLVRYTFFYILILLLCSQTVLSQDDVKEYTVVDSLYREDQVYIGVTFNLLSNKPDGISQNGLSGSMQLGFIRDMPFNKRRNKAFGVGLGISIDTFNQDLLIAEEADGETTMFATISEDINVDKNRFTFYTLEFPIQYRWRTSTPTKYAFWRIHTGVQFGYIFRFKSTFISEGVEVNQTDIPELNKLQYGLTFAFGYGAFNFQAYYGINTLFNDDAFINGQNVNLQVVRLGLQFYFL